METLHTFIRSFVRFQVMFNGHEYYSRTVLIALVGVIHRFEIKAQTHAHTPALYIYIYCFIVCLLLLHEFIYLLLPFDI